jgi:hypothetical protein
MTENVLNNPTGTVTTPKPKTFGSVLKDILSFPFRLIWKLFKVALLALLAVILTLTAYCGVQATQPMTIPEAPKGMTYVQFLDNRLTVMNTYDAAYGKRWKKTDWLSLHATALADFGGFPFSTLLDVPEATFAVLYPGSKVDKWLQGTDSEYKFVLPRGEATWNNFPALFWEALQRSTWDSMVLRENKLPLPSLRSSK